MDSKRHEKEGLLIPSIRRRNIEEKINEYKKQKNTFESLNISNNGEIYSKIRMVLLTELNIDIEVMYKNDDKSFDMILSTFFGEKNPMTMKKMTEPMPTRNDLLQTAQTEAPEQTFPNEIKSITLADCKYPLHTTMVMCFVAHTMYNIIREGSGQLKEQELFSHLKEHWQTVACNSVNHLNSLKNGPKFVRKALHTDYNFENTNTESFKKSHGNSWPYKEYLFRKFDNSKEILYIAYKAEAMKFLSQKVCLNLINTRDGWNYDQDYSKNGKRSFKERICRKFWRPLTLKLWFHAISRVLYIVMFAYMLCRFPVYRVYGVEAVFVQSYFLTVYYVIAVLISQMSNTSIRVLDFVIFEYYRGKAIKKNEDRILSSVAQPFQYRKSVFLSFERYFKLNNLAFWKIILIFPVLMLEGIQFLFFETSADEKAKSMNATEVPSTIDSLHHNSSADALHATTPHPGAHNSTSRIATYIPLMMEILYCSLFAIATTSSLRFIYSVKKIGFFVHMIQKMGKTVGMFVLVFLVFWMVLAVIHVSVTRAYDPNNGTLIHIIAAQGKFEIFGEVQDSDREGTLDSCSNYTLTFWRIHVMNYEEASCLLRTSIIPFLVFVYIFGTGILLVNLLTAQLTKEYEEESEKSGYYEGYLKYEQLTKIKSKLFLPPPLSFIYVILRALLTIFSLISFICEPFFYKCFSISIDWITKLIWRHLVVLFEGDQYGAVRQCEEYPETEVKIREYLENAPCHIWEQLRQHIDIFEKNLDNRDNMENLIEAQLELFRLLENEKYNESTTNRGKSRMALRQKSISSISSQYVTNYERASRGELPLPPIDGSTNSLESLE